MLTVAHEANIEFEEKKSRFIGYIKPVTTVADAENYINSIKALHPSATHNVPMFRVIENGQEYLKYNDDGEPSGTAGKPMADIAVLMGIYNVVIVATRYFGGIKLGSGGLIRMYAKTAKLAIYEANIIEPKTTLKFNITFDYDMTSKVKEVLHRVKAIILNETYADKVSYTIEVDEKYKEDIFIYNTVVNRIQ